MSSSNERYKTLKLPCGEHLIIEQNDDGTHYRRNKRTNRFFDSIEKMRTHELLCDVTLVVDDNIEIHAHKLILAASSLFFYSMFSVAFGETKARFIMDGVNFEALSAIIRYFYTGAIVITEDNVDRLLQVANKLAATDVYNACCHFLQVQMNNKNCFRIAALAREYDCVDLVARADDFMKRHFLDIVESDDFLDLPHQRLTKIIKSNKLNVCDEIKVFTATMSWVKHNVETRQQYLIMLMNFVRFPLMSLEDLIEKVAMDPLFDANVHCSKLMNEAIKYHFMKGDKKATFTSLRVTPRLLKDSVQAKALIVVGVNNKTLTMERYDFDERQWLKGPESFSIPWRSGSILLNAGDRIYMIGGRHEDTNRKVDVFDLKLGQWEECRDLVQGRKCPAAAILNGNLYVSGGKANSFWLKSCEMLDQETGDWVQIANMKEERWDHAMCTMNGEVYAVGGKERESMECYSPDKETWLSFPDMFNRRRSHGVIAVGNKLYVMKGRVADDCLKSNDVFNAAKRGWSMPPDVTQIQRAQPGVAEFDGIIYIAGGCDSERKELDSVEVND